MKETWILGISISDRANAVARVQDILAKFGCSIRTRLGLHNTSPDAKAGSGIILLELCGDPSEFSKLENALMAVDGTEIKKMVFKPE
jgi:hypothetical protein